MKNWLAYINSLHSREIDLGLSRITSLAEKLSLNNFACPVVTVAGTNGKGSVVKSLESIYLAAGYKVAAYTSPHLLQFNERLRLNGEPATDELFIEAFKFIEDNRNHQPLSFFEFTTLAIFYICKKQNLDILLLEVGLGGRLDAVNIVEPDVTVITTIDIDHTDWLGEDRESIGREKAGIIRRHKPVIGGDPNLPNSVYEQVHLLEAPFYQLEKDFFAVSTKENWQWQGPTQDYQGLPLPSLKIENIATSLMVIHCLQSQLPVSQHSLIAGIKNAVLPGRFEWIQTPAPIVFDVAHNPQATAYLSEQLRKTDHAGRTLGVVGMLRDKDIPGALKPMLSCIDQWYAGTLSESRGATSANLQNVLSELQVENCYNFDSVADAFKKAVEDCRPQDRIVVFGSFYTVAMAKEVLLGGENGN
ncbi:bifunctional tetrahydrofolate synthase/dihydrofolate synthase [Coxiella burnetii]|uniref:bifunctional tetrahydrofolate synthase/dihydrofolate synthase n=1 Tax=Coxiella burnetii TaxID=777 RepID=UPI000183CD2A|nr:bifunctional tetrahydrofolate synthase/dihydrofolate synthase [Coxiella burnetii]ACJ18446.1 folylpolyglutamate synthase [Coxiella burnetii CbuG_Q212]ATN66827.1 diaminohydroxyphosphoribosylaminopyrimidine deaminase [Coxiella burnetii]OYK86151.1 bifunctional tetrahydrofolate synthase/dihydrofolate synthase [Coxiella burnetii]